MRIYSGMNGIERRGFAPAGQVQGVGFRPFVFRLALKHGLSGTVGNSPGGVLIEVQGLPAALDAFEPDLFVEIPPLAEITACRREILPVRNGEERFCILSTP